MKTCFWCYLQIKVLIVFFFKRWAPFFEVKQRCVPFLPEFSRIFPGLSGILPKFSEVCPNFQGFCQHFRQIKTFGGALAPLHH